MTETTHAVWLDRTGPASNLVLRETPLPPPGAGEVRVRIEATGVAYADVVMRTGLYPGVKPPVVPGYDLVGMVEAVGEAVTGLRVGQRVAGVTVTGSYAQHRNVEARLLVPAPEGVDAGLLVAACMNGLTAWQMFHRIANPAAGEWVLVHGAAGGVGSLLLQLARSAGVRAVGTASRGKHAGVVAAGAVPVDYQAENFVARTRQITGAGVVAAFDHVGGAHLKRSRAALSAGGTAVLYGAYSATKGGRPNPLELVSLLASSGLNAFQLFGASQGVVGYNVAQWRDARPLAYREDLASMLAAVAAGSVTPVIAARLPLAEAGEAHRMLEGASVSGKIVLIP